MSRLGFLHRVILGGTAALGVIAAHGAAYLVAAPNPHVRQDLLESTGHGYWAVAIAAGVGLFVAALAGVVWAGLRSPDPASPGKLFRGFAARLALLQAAGFVLLEGAERLAVGGSLAELWTTPVVGIGIVAQVLVALVGAALVAALARVVAAVAMALRPVLARPVRSLAAPAASAFVWAPAHLALGGLTLRGPPSSE